MTHLLREPLPQGSLLVSPGGGSSQVVGCDLFPGLAAHGLPKLACAVPWGPPAPVPFRTQSHYPGPVHPGGTPASRAAATPSLTTAPSARERSLTHPIGALTMLLLVFSALYVY